MALQNVEANITLDLYNHDTTPATVKAIQLDSQTRYVAAMLQSMGAEYGLDSNATVQLIVIRPDKVGVQITGTTFTYGDEGAQFLGPYAELTQVALAVNGKMRGQFKITSGTQILRTEIFAISNGEALDASTDEWADEYDGYNLEEMATSIATNTADIATLEADVSQIKEDLSDMNTATASDVGKYLRATAVENGKVTSWQFSTPSGGGGGGGQDGFSPIVAVTNITGGHRVSITDADGTKTFDVMDGTNGTNGTNGTDGFSPTVTVTDITGGHRVSITDATSTKTFDVINGTNGANGTNGFSPTVTVTNITGGHRVSITDATGTQTFDVMDGTSSGGGSSVSVYYVTPEDYGAVGDGTTDDTNALTQAFNSGKPVVLTQGKTYFCLQLTVTHPLLLIGNNATIKTRSITVEEYNNGKQRMLIFDDTATNVIIRDVNFYTTADQTIYGAHGDRDAAIPNRSIRCAIAVYGVDKLSVVNCTFTNFDTPINGQRHGSDTNYEYIANSFYLKDCRIHNSLMGAIGYFHHVVVDGCEIVEDANARSGEHCLYFLIDVLETAIIANSAFYTHDGDCGSCIQFYIPSSTSTLPTGIKREYRIDGCLFFGDAFISNSGGGKCYASACTMKTINYKTANRRRQFECAITDGGVIEVTDSVVNLELQDRTDQALVFRNCNVYSTRLMGDRFSLYKAYNCQFDNISFNLSNNGEIINCSFDSTVSVLGRYYLTVPSATTMSKVINCYFNAGQNVSAVAYGCAGTCYLVSPTSALPFDGGSNTGLNITNPITITTSGGGDGGDDTGSTVIYDSTATIVASNPNYVSVSTNETINEGETWKVTWNGAEYTFTPVYSSQISGYYIGNPSIVGGTDDGSGATFWGYKKTASQLAFSTTDSAGTITLKVEKITS